MTGAGSWQHVRTIFVRCRVLPLVLLQIYNGRLLLIVRLIPLGFNRPAYAHTDIVVIILIILLLIVVPKLETHHQLLSPTHRLLRRLLCIRDVLRFHGENGFEPSVQSDVTYCDARRLIFIKHSIH